MEPYRITRFQRNGTQRKSFEKFMRSGRKERNENIGNFNTRENVIEFIRGDKQMTVTFSQRRFITKVKKMAEKYPNEVTIVAENEDGSICAHMPIKALQLSIRKKELTEEQREKLRERLKKMREKRKNGDESFDEDELEDLEDQLDDEDLEEDEIDE